MNLFITGTSKGLGFGFAKYYLKNNHMVYAVSRNNNQELSQYPNYHFKSLDLTNHEILQSHLKTFVPTKTNLDIAILNAGILNEIKDLQNTTLSEIKQTMDTNVWANKLIIDMLLESHPEINQIIAISSGASVSGARGWNAYALSKATLNMLINLYAKEKLDTHFCALAPGLIDTEMQTYISELPKNDNYTVVEKLKKLKGTPEMPKPEIAAEKLSNAFEKIKTYESGKFLDIRKLS